MAQDPTEAIATNTTEDEDKKDSSKNETETTSNTGDTTTNDTNKYFDSELESTKLKQYIELALNPASGKEWTKYNSKDDRIDVKYTQIGNDKLLTIRGQMDIEVNIDLHHEYAKGGYDDIFVWEKENDEMCTNMHSIKHIDDDHTVVYGSFNAGFGLWPRDFCWMKRRFLFEKFQGEDGKTYRVTGDLCYSLDEKHAYFKPQAKGHVRGWLAMSGNIFVEKDDKICGSTYIVNLDPCGWIPAWIANLVAPEQGMVIKHVYDNYHKIVETMKQRKEKEGNKPNAKTKTMAKGTFLE